MARLDFRFVVDGVDLDEAARARIAGEIQKAGLEALHSVNARLINPVVVGHGNLKLRPSTAFLGMITPAGKVAYLTPEVPTALVRDTLDDSAGPLEARYRFAGPCITSGCGFWTGKQCGLGAKMVESYQETGAAELESAELPRRAIRRNCRWFAEQGPSACSPCSFVVTEGRCQLAPGRTPRRQLDPR